MTVAQRFHMHRTVVKDDAWFDQSVIQREIDFEAIFHLFHEFQLGRPKAWIRHKYLHRLAFHTADVPRIQFAQTPQQFGETSHMVDVGM